MKYPKLFEPGKIANLDIKNRMVMAPLAMGVSDDDQTVGNDFLRYLMERVDGGIGMIVIENTRIDDEHGAAETHQASMSKDIHIAPMKRAVEAFHAKGVVAFTQLHHPGRETFSNINSNEPVWSSGSRPCGVCQQETHEMTTEETELVIRKFVEAAVRSQKAGLDGVELHGAHGYLITQFLSPYTNQRKDRFGGSFEGRFRFVREIIEGIRNACGKDFPIGIRLTVDELLEKNGVKEYLRIEDGVKVCQELEKMGVVYINVSQGIYESFNSLSEPMTYPQGSRTDLIRKVRDAVKVPVIAVNMVKEPWFAEKMLEDGLVDFVGLGRAVVADPEWPKKAFEGREEEINRCISCTFCFETLVSDAIPGIGPVKCAVNPRAGRETKYPDYKKEGNGRCVAIVGSGVAGLEAARVLSLRGFKPVIFEKEDTVGGQINIANKPPEKDKINWIVDYEMHQLKMNGVEIRTGVEATPENIKALDPYAVIVATGAVPLRPSSIKGADLPNAYTIDQVLSGEADVKNCGVVLVGSGATGLETAEFICENGNSLTIVEMLDSVGKDVYVQHYLDAMDRLSKFDVKMMPSHELVEIKENSVVLKNIADGGKIAELPCRCVVLALGVKPVNALSGELEKSMERVYTVGDAKEPGRIESAIRSAFETAYNLR